MRPILASLFLAAGVAAQFPGNEFTIWPDAVDATSRDGLPDNATGDIVIAVRTADFRYVGNTVAGGAAVGTVLGFTGTVQDQDASTVQSVTFVIRPEDPSAPGQPDPNQELVRTAPMALPSGIGPAAFVLTATLATPFQSPNLATSTWFFGVGLPASPTWPSDGLSVHMASYYGLGSPFPTVHDNPSASAVDLAWSVDTTNVLVMQTTAPRTHRLGVLTDAVVLNSGQDVAPVGRTGPNPMFGAGGIWPDNTGSRPNRMGMGDGIALRVRDVANAGGMAIVFAGFGPVTAGNEVVLPGFGGVVPLPSMMAYDVPMGMAKLPGSGEAVIQSAMMQQGKLVGISGTVVWVALTLDQRMGNPRLSNVAATHLD